MRGKVFLQIQTLTDIQQSNKENGQLGNFQGVTLGKKYSTISSEQDYHRSNTIIQREKTPSDNPNKTTSDNLRQKMNKNPSKLDELYFLQNTNQTYQKQKQIKNNQHVNILINNFSPEDGDKLYVAQKKNMFAGSISREQGLSPKHFQSVKKKKPPLFLRVNSCNTPDCLVRSELEESQNKFRKIVPTQLTNNSFSVTTLQPTIFEECSHVMRHIRPNYNVNHVFDKNFSCGLSMPIIFHLPKTNKETLKSDKVSRILSSQYQIYLCKHGQQYELGTLKSNFSGSVYNFHAKNSQSIHFSILFNNKSYPKQSNFCYSQIYVNRQLQANISSRTQIVSYRKMDSLQGVYLLNKDNKKYNPIYRLRSKLPQWSQSQQSYSLDFGAKNIMPSTKNTSLIDDEDKQIMRFYKNSYLTYNVSFEYPLSWVLAYGYALASTDFKLASG